MLVSRIENLNYTLLRVVRIRNTTGVSMILDAVDEGDIMWKLGHCGNIDHTYLQGLLNYL